jgi:hypothetical protein
MFLDWQNPSSGEDYDIDRAALQLTCELPDEPGDPWHEVRVTVSVPMSYTDRTNPTLVGSIHP